MNKLCIVVVLALFAGLYCNQYDCGAKTSPAKPSDCNEIKVEDKTDGKCCYADSKKDPVGVFCLPYSKAEIDAIFKTKAWKDQYNKFDCKGSYLAVSLLALVAFLF